MFSMKPILNLSETDKKMLGMFLFATLDLGRKPDVDFRKDQTYYLGKPSVNNLRKLPAYLFKVCL